MTTLCIILGIITVISLISLFIFINDIKEITKQIDYKNKTKSHFDISIQSHTHPIKELQSKINILYENISNIEIIALKKEKEMQTIMSGISHDIRTPLTSIKGYLKLLEETDNEIEKEKYFKIIEYRLETLESMLEDLFMHSKINDTEYKIEKENIELFPIICKVLASFYYDFENKNISPIIHFSNEHMHVTANQEMLIRMIQNLISNVLQHGYDYFEIKEQDKCVYFINKIKNTQRIDPKQLFDRFYKADVSRHQNSTGLGLSIVKRIAEVHNWKVNAYIENEKLYISIQMK